MFSVVFLSTYYFKYSHSTIPFQKLNEKQVWLRAKINLPKQSNFFREPIDLLCIIFCFIDANTVLICNFFVSDLSFYLSLCNEIFLRTTLHLFYSPKHTSQILWKSSPKIMQSKFNAIFFWNRINNKVITCISFLTK